MTQDVFETYLSLEPSLEWVGVGLYTFRLRWHKCLYSAQISGTHSENR